MAGYITLDEYSGEEVNLMYDYPFMVRGTPRKLGHWNRPEATTVASFRTEAQAKEFVAKWEAEYKKGKDGFASLHIENWNV